MNYLKALFILLVSCIIIQGCLSKKTKIDPAPIQVPEALTKVNDLLDGLTKADLAEIGNSKMVIDGETIPVYLPDGKRVRGMEMMNIFMKGEYVIEPYVNQEEEVKVILLREATEEEKKETESISTNMGKESDLVGKTATPFKVQDISGVEYALDQLNGKIVVLNFWFIACKPCVMEMPDLNHLVEKYANKEVLFIAFALDDKDDLENFLLKNNFNYKIIPNSMETAKNYDVSSYPTHIVLNKSSKIELVLKGLSSTTIEQIDDEIGSLLEQR